MIKLNDYELFFNNIVTLKDTSKDDTNDEYMIDSPLPVINFDGVKSSYVRNLHLPAIGDSTSERCKSFDALYISETGEIFFIEFKNGKISPQKRRDISVKMRDGLLLFCDIVEKNINFTRENIIFILVYNEEKSPLTDDELKKIEEMQHSSYQIQGSSSRDYITKTLYQKSDLEFVRYGYKKYEGLFFKKVHTYSKQEFKEKFIKLMCK